MAERQLLEVLASRRQPTPTELDAFAKRLGKWLADVATSPRRVDSRQRANAQEMPSS